MNITPFFRYPPDHRQLPLHYQVETTTDLQEVCRLLQGGENPNRLSDLRNTPLHIAVLNLAERGPIVNALIQAGADVNLKNIYNNTALDLAVIYKKHEAIEMLIKAGANVNNRDEIGNTTLHFAIKSYLLFKRMNSRFICTSSTTQVDLWIVDKLIQNGAEINARNVEGESPLYLAVDVGNPTLVKMLLHMGAQTNVYTRFGCTPLHMALLKRKMNLDIIYKLLSHGAKTSFRNIYSLTPWQIAIGRYLLSPWWERRNAQCLLKPFVLFTNEYRTFRMPDPTPDTIKSFRFYQKCTFEVDLMKSDVITLNYSVHDFVTNKTDEEYQKSGFPESKACDYVFRNLKRGIYVVYVDWILNRIGRSYLTKEFIKARIYAKDHKLQTQACLQKFLLHEISLHLSLLDLFNFILAKDKYRWLNTSRGFLQRNILYLLHKYAPNYMKTNFVLSHL